VGYRHYADRFQNARQQYNIMALVGNGFDIQVLSKYKRSPTTRYEDFYDAMIANHVNPNNLIVHQMESLKTAGKHNWSDVEARLKDLSRAGETVTDIIASLTEVRREFSKFLNDVVSSSLLADLSEDAENNAWSRGSLSKFLRDLDTYQKLKRVAFGARMNNYDAYNFFFVNFNYTSLLDNYLFLDSTQFDPHPNTTVDTNFMFNTNPRGLGPATNWNFDSSSYLTLEVVHPHGYQDIPRSLLFGTEYDGNPTGRSKKLAKAYWAQNDLKYSDLFDETALFIVFGCSLGNTDSWWWENIIQSLLADSSRAAIIYWWNPLGRAGRDENGVLDLFMTAGDISLASDEADQLRDQVSVVVYTDQTERVWLSMLQPN